MVVLDATSTTTPSSVKHLAGLSRTVYEHQIRHAETDTMTTILYKNFDATKLTVAEPDTTSMGSRLVKIIHDNKPYSRIVIQTPKLRCLWGLNSYSSKQTGDIESTSMELSLDDYKQEGSPSEIMLGKLEALDAFILNEAVKNSEKWFGKKVPVEILREFYRPLVTQKNPDYAPVMKMKFNLAPDTKNPRCQFFFDGKEVDASYLTRGSQVRVIFEVSSIWFINKRSFGVSLKPIQVLILSQGATAKAENFTFVDDDDDDGAAAASQPNDAAAAALKFV
jgi:hypothetical protein